MIVTFRKIVQTQDSLVQHILDSISRSIERPIGLDHPVHHPEIKVSPIKGQP